MPLKNAEGSVSARARSYQAMKNRLFLFHLSLNVFFLALFFWGGWSYRLKCGLVRFTDDFFVVNALYLVCFGVLSSVIFFPLDFYDGFWLERRFGLSRQRWSGWLKDFLKRAAIGGIVGFVFAQGLYYFLSAFSRTWWLAAAGFWFLISVVLARVFPQVILPLFFKSTPLAAGPLRDRLTAFLTQEGIRLKDIRVLDFSKKTVKANALVAGLGRTKQIFLTDTLVRDFSVEEVLQVLAHEAGHWQHGDIRKLAFAGLAAALVCFYAAAQIFSVAAESAGLAGASDITGLPLLLLLFLGIGLVLLPFQNGYARRLERAADQYALGKTGQPDAFISMMRRLAEKNLADPAPPRWVEIFLHDHPPMGQRIAMAERFKKEAVAGGI
jgi:STE24 endopeptidase